MTPRDFALYQLDQKTLPGWAAGAIRKKPSAPPADPRDLALAEHIVVGVTKNLLLIQHLMQHYSGRSLKSIDLLVQKIIAVGLYQLRFLTRVPASAAVDQAVEQAKRFGQSKASGFVNAVLRKATREGEVVLPGREAGAEYARVVLSHPRELFDRLAKLLGVEDAVRFCEHDQGEAPTIVRVGQAAGQLHKSRTPSLPSPGVPGEGTEVLAGNGIEWTAHEQAGMFVVTGARRADFARWAEAGVAQVQDPTSAGVVEHLGLEAGMRVLDRCCGLGTKTLQIREGVGEGGEVVAVDPSAERCEGLRRLLAKRKIGNVMVHQTGWMKDVPSGEKFDRILADVPCSNSGVLARRAEARYGQTAENLKSLQRLQDQILRDTAPHLRGGGLFVYATCSVWPEENRQRVEAFLSEHPDYELVGDRLTWPSFETKPTRYRDGGYFATMRRK